MEYLNKVELQGKICRVFNQRVGDSIRSSIAVATVYCYRAKDNTPAFETTSHECVAMLSEEEVSKLRLGYFIHLTGRLRVQRYTDSDGIEKRTFEIIVGNIHSIKNPNSDYPKFQKEK